MTLEKNHKQRSHQKINTLSYEIEKTIAQQKQQTKQKIQQMQCQFIMDYLKPKKGKRVQQLRNCSSLKRAALLQGNAKRIKTAK